LVYNILYNLSFVLLLNKSLLLNLHHHSTTFNAEKRLVEKKNNENITIRMLESGKLITGSLSIGGIIDDVPKQFST